MVNGNPLLTNHTLPVILLSRGGWAVKAGTDLLYPTPTDPAYLKGQWLLLSLADTSRSGFGQSNPGCALGCLSCVDSKGSYPSMLLHQRHRCLKSKPLHVCFVSKTSKFTFTVYFSTSIVGSECPVHFTSQFLCISQNISIHA